MSLNIELGKMKCNSNVLIDFQSGNYICISHLGCVLLLLLLSFCKVCVWGGVYIFTSRSMYLEARIQSRLCSSITLYLSTLIFEIGSLMNLELISVARLASQ